jgi:hypothetical protein
MDLLRPGRPGQWYIYRLSQEGPPLWTYWVHVAMASNIQYRLSQVGPTLWTCLVQVGLASGGPLLLFFFLQHIWMAQTYKYLLQNFSQPRGIPTTRAGDWFPWKRNGVYSWIIISIKLFYFLEIIMGPRRKDKNVAPQNNTTYKTGSVQGQKVGM